MTPSVNHAYFTTKQGKRILTAKAKQWIAQVQAIATEEVQKQNWSITSGQKVIVEILTYWPDNRRRDCNNGAKLTFDALEGIIYDDDKWTLPRYIDFFVDKSNPRLELRIYPKV